MHNLPPNLHTFPSLTFIYQIFPSTWTKQPSGHWMSADRMKESCHLSEKLQAIILTSQARCQAMWLFFPFLGQRRQFVHILCENRWRASSWVEFHLNWYRKEVFHSLPPIVYIKLNVFHCIDCCTSLVSKIPLMQKITLECLSAKIQPWNIAPSEKEYKFKIVGTREKNWFRPVYKFLSCCTSAL